MHWQCRVCVIIYQVIVSNSLFEGDMKPYVWMGGGAPVVKLGVSVHQLVTKLDAIVADVSDPRDDAV